jgi:formylglycine-generating enzyme required for sulfatase activity
VLEATGCQGGFPGLYGMSGNAAEWEDTCSSSAYNDPSTDMCTVRGGSVSDYDPTQLACSSSNDDKRNAQLPIIGFRCCAEVR